LGFSDDKPDWYGGKVEFRAKVRDVGTTDAPKYKIVLEKPVLGTSCRFTRRFGSHSFLRVKIPAAILENREHELIKLFCRPFILTGRVFRAFYAKKDHVFLFKTCEVFDGSKLSVLKGTRKSGMAWREFLDWHNPLFCNCRQVNKCCLSSAFP
jgi:RNA-dependent RNA polymerase